MEPRLYSGSAVFCFRRSDDRWDAAVDLHAVPYLLPLRHIDIQQHPSNDDELQGEREDGSPNFTCSISRGAVVQQDVQQNPQQTYNTSGKLYNKSATFP